MPLGFKPRSIEKALLYDHIWFGYLIGVGKNHAHVGRSGRYYILVEHLSKGGENAEIFEGWLWRSLEESRNSNMNRNNATTSRSTGL